MTSIGHRPTGVAAWIGKATCVASAFLAAAFLAPPAVADSLTVEIESYGEASGTVTGPGEIDCSGPPAIGVCSHAFAESPPQGVLAAIADSGSAFAGWSGLSVSFIPEDNCHRLLNPCMVWLSGMGDRTVTAHFAPRVFSAEDAPQCGDGRYIVVFEDWVEDPEARAQAHMEQYGGKLGFVYRHGAHASPLQPRAYYSVSGLAASDAVSLAGEPAVEYVMPAEHATAMFPDPPPEQTAQCEQPEAEPVGGRGPEAIAEPLAFGGAALGSVVEAAQRRVKGCGANRMIRGGRCVPLRLLARRACRRSSAAARFRCVRRELRRLRRIRSIQVRRGRY